MSYLTCSLTVLDLSYDLKLFCRVRSEFPAFKSKIQVVKGEVTQPDLGLSNEDKETILCEVSIVFHLAATVSFDEPIR